MTSLELLQEIDAWLSINTEPSKEEVAELRKSIKDHLTKQSNTHDVNDSLCYSEREIDFAYLVGVFNVSGIDGLQKEIERLKELDKNPHDITIAAREQLNTHKVSVRYFNVCDSCGCHPNVIYTTSKGRFCERCKPAN
ncbi:MAG TPA: hypothetical protein GXZ79_02885 [Acholeplasma sp.]|nr:hypothetical protein [Acholeplasma sp.]